jgi:hypothetical protein
LWNYILREKPNGKDWHKRAYLMDDYISCGIETLKVCPIEETKSIKIVQWQQYARVVARQKDIGEDQKVP